MTKFPDPPTAATLSAIEPVLARVPRGSLQFRIYYRGGPHPVLWSSFRAFGPTQSRFDHHLDPPRVQDRQIVYTASEIACCIAEVFQSKRLVDRSTGAPWLAGFELVDDLSLLDLTSAWSTRAGASMVINSGNRNRARAWSRAIYEAYPPIQGLLYASSMYRNSPCTALYERALPALPGAPCFNRPLDDPALLSLLRNVCRDIGYDLV